MANILDKKEHDNFTPKTVILAGNGLIKASDKPIEKALKSKIFDPPINVNGNPNKMTLLAIHSSNYRMMRNIYLSDMAKSGSSMEFDDFGEQDLISMINFRKELAHNFKEEKLTLKNDSVVDPFINKELNKERVGVITTNWDNVLWNDPRIKNIVHIHGRCDYYQSLILPTELSHDEDIFDLLSNQNVIKQENLEKFRQYYRGGFRKILLECHDLARTWLMCADKLIIWGVAFNTYDAELNTLIREYRSNRTKIPDVTVINPNKEAADTTKSLLNVEPNNFKHIIPCVS